MYRFSNLKYIYVCVCVLSQRLFVIVAKKGGNLNLTSNSNKGAFLLPLSVPFLFFCINKNCNCKKMHSVFSYEWVNLDYVQKNVERIEENINIKIFFCYFDFSLFIFLLFFREKKLIILARAHRKKEKKHKS